MSINLPTFFYPLFVTSAKNTDLILDNLIPTNYAIIE